MRRTARFLLYAVLGLIILGIVMLRSTSTVPGELKFGDAYHFVNRQFLWILLGSFAMYLAARFNYWHWKKLAIPVGVITVILLVLTVFPGIRREVNGSYRWLVLGPFRFQPSEMAKLSTVILLAWWMARVQRGADKVLKGVFVPVCSMGLILLLIFIESDFGTTLLIGVVGMTLMFVAGSRFGYLGITSIIGLICFSLAVMNNEESWRRIIAFLNPQKYAQAEAFQLLNAIYAFALGGAGGSGLGESLQKMRLPEAHTDFIFAILGEELGFRYSLLVVVLFLVIFICGLHISLHARDDFGKLLSFGITLMIALQATMNIAVVTGCMPTKGIGLPFISYGGSSLLVSMTMIGVLMNIARYTVADDEVEKQAIKDIGHSFAD